MNVKSQTDSGLNRSQKEAISYSRKLFEQLERVAEENDPDRCLTAYRLLEESMARMTGIDRKQIDTILSKARDLVEPPLMQKIESLLEKAMEAARAGDLPNCRVFSKLVKDWNEKCRTIVTNREFWEAVHKQLAIIAETTPRGTSSQARKDGEESGQIRANIFQNEKRRYIRYMAPEGLTVKLPPSSEQYRIRDISMEGMQILGNNELFVIGKKITVEVLWLVAPGEEQNPNPNPNSNPNPNPRANSKTNGITNPNANANANANANPANADPKAPTTISHSCIAQVVRMTNLGVGLFFEQLKGPTLFLVKERHIDLNMLTMVID